LKCRDADFAGEFSRCFEVITGHRHSIRMQERMYIAEGCSKTLYNLLKKPIDLEKLRLFIEYNDETIAAFLTGFYDAEGYVKKSGKCIYLSNTNKELIEYVKTLLLKLRIMATGPYLRPQKGRPFYDKKDCYVLEITRKSSKQKFAEVIGFTMKRKMDRLLKAFSP
jgi:intein-encoded DNA endonuclease-like protein